MLNDSMRVFLAVAEKRNFSKAAKSLSLTQPAVSFQIQMLEQFYGTVLFDRVNRNITLTAAGELLRDYAKEMDVLQSEVEKEMQKLTGKIKGKLLIGASTTIGEYILPYLVGSFKKKLPEVHISLEVANTQVIEKHILDNSLDVALVEGPVKSADLVIEEFLDDQLVLIVSPDHLWAKKQKISINELENCAFISREKGSGTRVEMEKSLKEAGFSIEKLNVSMELGSTSAIKAAVWNGLGVSIVSKWAVKEEVKLGKLVKVSILETDLKRKFIIIYHKKKFQTQARKLFLKYLKSKKKHI